MACNSNDKGPSPATCSQNLLHINIDGHTKQITLKVRIEINFTHLIT
jgi:hypothetical protein